MAMTTATNSGGPLVTPAETGALIVQPVIDEAVATQVSTVVTTGTKSFRIPGTFYCDVIGP